MVKADSKGNIWIGTRLGLSKYDIKNNEWFNYQRKDGLITDYITDVEFCSGSVMIGTDRGIGVMDEQSGIWRFYGYRDGLSCQFITVLAFNEKDIWAGTSSGLFRFDNEKKKWQNIKSLSIEGYEWYDQKINDLSYDKESNLWIGTENGIYKVTYSNGKVKIDHYTEDDGLSHNHINSIVTDNNGTVYAGTMNGLSIYKDGSWKKIEKEGEQKFQSHCIRSLVVDNDILWIGTLKELVKFNTEEGTFNKVNIENDNLRCDAKSMYLRDDSLWVGTSSGLFKN